MAKKKDPSQTSAAHDLMTPRIDLINTLMEGQDALHAKAEQYLPRHDMESQKNYTNRLQRSTLVNYFRRSVLSLVGKPFSTPIVLGDDMPAQLKTISEDIDRQGNNIDVFARRAFQDGLSKGLTHILVEFPDTVAAGVETQEDELKLGAAPYFIHVPPESILAAYCEYRNGAEFLTHVRIYEIETQRDGFDEVTIERVRILEPGTWELWRKHDKKWVFDSKGTTSIDFIPLITFYAEREDFMVARPPLTDLAHVNVAHYQSNSDQNNVLTVARFPMLAGSGLNEEEAKVAVGPKQVLTTIEPQGKFYYVEHTGKAIEAGRMDLKDMEEQMSILGIELLKKSGNATATAKAIDTAENLSMLQALALMFADALEQAYQVAASWLKLPSGGSVKIDTDFGLSLDSGSDLTVLQAARTAGDISRDTFLKELQRRSVLAEDFDADADLALVDKEKEQALNEQVFQMKLQQDSLLPKPGATTPPTTQ